MTTPLEIESAQNPRVKSVARLREKRGRNQAGQFLIDGIRECVRAIQSGAEVTTIICCPELVEASTLSTMHKLAGSLPSKQSDEPVLWHFSRQAFEKICFGERTEGVVAVAKSKKHTLAQIQLPPKPLIVVVEALEKPGNLGAIFRTADAIGADAVIIADPKVDTENPNAIRASLGTIFAVPHASSTTTDTIQWLKQNQIQPVAARVDAASYYHQVDYDRSVAIVLGSEADGLSTPWQNDDTLAVRIPMHGIADSLNISVSAAIILYEAGRQRGFKGEL